MWVQLNGLSVVQIYVQSERCDGKENYYSAAAARRNKSFQTATQKCQHDCHGVYHCAKYVYRSYILSDLTNNAGMTHA